MGLLPAAAALGQTARPGPGPYGPYSTTPDGNGLLLPQGFTSRVIAVAGEPVGDTGFVRPVFPDGAATFATKDGGWIHVCNSEVYDILLPDSGGVSAIRFDRDGAIVDAYQILKGSNSNCAGGPTPWGTWLSCEENLAEHGRVWECDPTGKRDAVAHEAMGLFTHEAVAVDPKSKTLYLTQDHPQGLIYRYTPTAYPDLSTGRLDACVLAADGSVTWQQVPDPSGTSTPTRQQVPAAKVFGASEGIWYHDGWVWFTVKTDNTVHGIDLRSQQHSVLWRGEPERLGVDGAVLSGVDNITVADGSRDLFVAEDAGNMEVVMITPEGVVAPFARISGKEHESSEITGPCFDPSGRRLYFSSQRGPTPKTVKEILPGFKVDIAGAGITYEVTGPFRGREHAAATPTTTLRRAASSGGDDGGSAVLPIGLGAGAVVALAGAAIAVRRRGDGSPPDSA
jgi:hypothetical protein